MSPGNDWFTAAEVFLNGDYCPPFTTPTIRSIVDLGGNVGYATVFLGRMFPEASIDVFEPHPAHVGALRENIVLNEMRQRVSVHPFAAGASCRSFYLTDADTCSSLVSNSGNGSIPVEVIDWLAFAESRKIDMLKMDIEGAEYEILFDPRFEKLRIPVICVEWHVRAGEQRPSVPERLRSIGYRVTEGAERTIPNLRYAMVWAMLAD
jgi:FkbM family methyltransferase